MFFGDRFYIGRKGETGEGGWGHHQAKKSVAVSGLYCRMALVGTRWPLSLPLCINGLTKQFSHLLFLAVKLFPVWTSGCLLKTVTNASSLMGGCGVSHNRVVDAARALA